MRHHIQYGGGDDGHIYFSGARRQRGAGLGGVFGAVARHLVPFFKRFILPHATSAVGAIASDMIAKKSLSTSIKEHGKQALKRVGSDILNQSGSGKRRKRNKQKTEQIQKVSKNKKRKVKGKFLF